MAPRADAVTFARGFLVGVTLTVALLVASFAVEEWQRDRVGVQQGRPRAGA